MFIKSISLNISSKMHKKTLNKIGKACARLLLSGALLGNPISLQAEDAYMSLNPQAYMSLNPQVFSLNYKDRLNSKENSKEKGPEVNLKVKREANQNSNEEPNTSFDLEYDFNENRSFDLSFYSNNNIDDAFFIKLGSHLKNNFGKFKNIAAPKIGLLQIDLSKPEWVKDSEEYEYQLLGGIEDKLSYPFGKGFNAFLKGSFAGSSTKGKNEWDNWSIGFGLENRHNLSKKASLINILEFDLSEHNNEKYLFLEREKTASLNSLLNWNVGKNSSIDVGFSIDRINRYGRPALNKSANASFSYMGWFVNLIGSDYDSKVNTKSIIMGKNFEGFKLEGYMTKDSLSGKFFGASFKLGLGDFQSNKEDYGHRKEDDILMVPLSFKNSDMDDLATGLDNLSDIMRWQKQNIRYLPSEDLMRKDREIAPDMYFRTADEVYRDKGGDCDELANFMAYLAQKNGYDSYIASFFNRDDPRGAHAIGLVNKGNRVYISDNGYFYAMDVPDGMSIEEKAALAIQKVNKEVLFRKGETAQFDLDKPSSDPSKIYSPYSEVKTFSYETDEENLPGKLMVERGIKSFVGNRF